jgi:hypothetical protein
MTREDRENRKAVHHIGYSEMALMITDLAAGPEIRSERDFVIVTSEYVH